MDNLKDFKYKKIPNFLDESEKNLLKEYAIIKHRLNQSMFEFNYPPHDTAIYADPLMESLLINKKSKMEEILKISLLPTYAYFRFYTKFSELKPHKDRDACEFSVTVNLGNDGTQWPIFMDKDPVDCLPGDAVIYRGPEVLHFRNEFEGDWCAQTFLHYVDKKGLYSDWYKDKRQLWGQDSPNNKG